MRPFIDDVPDITPSQWESREQVAEDARLAAIRRNIGADCGDLPRVTACRPDEGSRVVRTHTKKRAKPVVSDRGEWFRCAEDAAFAVGMASFGNIHYAIRTGCVSAGRKWRFADKGVAA